MKKKAQVAMEFLMTYGWALLIILIAIGALAYYGVLNVDRFLPESCILPQGLSCTSYKATTTTTILVIQNGLGQDITFSSIEIVAGGCTGTYTAASGELVNGDTETYTITGCTNGNPGSKFKSDVTVTYTDAASVLHSKTGELIVKVQ